MAADGLFVGAGAGVSSAVQPGIHLAAAVGAAEAAIGGGRIFNTSSRLPPLPQNLRRASVLLRHHHQRRPQQALVEQVALLEGLGDGSRGHARGIDHAHRLMPLRVEGIA